MVRTNNVSPNKSGVSLLRDERGMGTLEIVLILAVLIAIVLVFREQIISFLESLMEKATGKSDELFE
ncbi:Flp1 family type IVb pilin [Cohnella sp. GCM10027633]|uniref:Flp1 family type IVb pilin n=1 Tax=unclassified Cohnella TaxID=2636738 RepID=UPI00362E9030